MTGYSTDQERTAQFFDDLKQHRHEQNVRTAETVAVAVAAGYAASQWEKKNQGRKAVITQMSDPDRSSAVRARRIGAWLWVLALLFLVLCLAPAVTTSFVFIPALVAAFAAGGFRKYGNDIVARAATQLQQEAANS